MGKKIEISTIIEILLFFGISINIPKIVSSLNKDIIYYLWDKDVIYYLWIFILIVLIFIIYTFNNKIKEFENKMKNFDTRVKVVEESNNKSNSDVNNDLTGISREIALLLLLKILKEDK